ncbi:DUF2946 family protein [Pseudomonas sp. GCM10022188]|uniref:DUF2946 family protein n=1 Tax=Pseudomonas TaxID=286 RepID=UPI001E5C7E1E|nr:DUF2946 domain-containing protein [Pseudomonas oryzagri]MCC6073627.1 DUF2946 domain-containing protein [Pseudomonas oryzagri]
MSFSSTDRMLTAWVLYCSLLLALFACSLGHGQMAGLQLNGVGGAFCSLQDNPGPVLDSGFDEPAPGDALDLFGCSCCSSFVLLALPLLLALGPWLRPQRRWRSTALQRGGTPPRHAWPPANPRAP